MPDSPTIDALFNENTTPMQDLAGELSGNPEEFNQRMAVSHFIGMSSGVDPIDVLKNFGVYHELVFGEQSLQESFESAKRINFADEAADNQLPPEYKFFPEVGKSLARGTVNLVGGGVSGAASLIGLDQEAFSIAETNRRLIKSLAPSLDAMELREITKQTRGVFAQAFTPEWWATQGAELAPNIVLFSGGALGVRGLAKLAFQSRRAQHLAAVAGGAVVLGGGESVIEGGSSIAATQELGEHAQEMLDYLDSLDDETRIQMFNEGLLESSYVYQQQVNAGMDHDLAGVIASQVMLDNAGLNLALNALGLGAGRVAVSSLFQSGIKTKLFKAGSSFAVSLGAEAEQELRQDEIIDTAIIENTLDTVIKTRMLEPRLFLAFLTGDPEKLDTVLASVIMGSRSAIINLVADVYSAKSEADAEARMRTGIERLRRKRNEQQTEEELPESPDRPQQTDATPVDVERLSQIIDDFDRADTLEARMEVLRSAGAAELTEIHDTLTEGVAVEFEERQIALETEASEDPLLRRAFERERPVEPIQTETDEVITQRRQRISEVVSSLGFQDVEIVDNVEALPSPVRDEADRRFGAARVEGFFSPQENKVYLVAANISDARIEPVVLHEVVGHAGLHNTLGEARLNAVLDQVFASDSPEITAEIQALSERRGIDLSSESGRREAVEEVLASIAEDPGQAPGLWKRIVAGLKQLLRDAGFKVDFTENDIKTLLFRARDGRQVRGPGERGLRFSFSQDESDVIVDFAGRIFRGDKVTPQMVGKALKRAGVEGVEAKDVLASARRIAKRMEDISKLPGDPIQNIEEERRQRFARGFQAGEFTEQARARLELKRERARADRERQQFERSKSEFQEAVRNLKKDLRDQFRAHIENADVFRQAIRKWVMDTGLPREQRIDILDKLEPSIKNLFKAKTEAAQTALFEDIVQKAMAIQLDIEKRENVAKIKELIAKTRKGRKDKRVGQIGPPEKVKATLDRIEPLIGLKLEEYEDRSQKLEREINEKRLELGDDSEVVVQLEIEQMELEFFGALQARDPDIAARALNALEFTIAADQSLYERVIQERRDRWNQARNAIVGQLGEVSPLEFDQRRNQPKGIITRINDVIDSTTNKSLSLKQKLERVADLDPTGVLDRLVGDWNRWIWEASNTESAEVSRKTEELHEKIRELYGVKDVDSVLLKLGRDRADITLAVPDSNERFAITLTRDQMLYVYLSMTQPSLVENMEKNGYDNVTMIELVEKLADEDIQLALWMREQLSDNYNEINEVYQSLFGADMPSNANYFPFQPVREDVAETDVSALDQPIMEMRTMMNPGAVIARVKHNVRLDVAQGATFMYLRHHRQMEHFKTFAERGKDFFAVMGDPRVKRSIIFNYGDSLYRQIMSHAEQVMNGGNRNFNRNPMIDKLRNAFIVKALSGNVAVFAKQLTSLPAFWANMSTAEFVKALFRPWRISEFQTLIQTDYVQNRWKQGNHIEALWILENARKPGWLFKAFRAGMITTRAGDLVPILIMGRGIYFSAFRQAKAEGQSDVEAAKYAEFVFGSLTNETQQSSLWQDRTHWQRSGSFGQALSMFQTSPRQYFAVAARSVQRWKGRRDAQSRHNMAKSIFIMFGVLPAAFTWVSKAFNELAMGEDPDDEEAWKTYLIASLQSPMNGVFFARFFSEGIIEKMILGKERFAFGESFAVIGLKQDIMSLYKAGMSPFTDDELLEEVSRVFPAVKQTKTIFEEVTE